MNQNVFYADRIGVAGRILLREHGVTETQPVEILLSARNACGDAVSSDACGHAWERAYRRIEAAVRGKG
jgi:hypothetical protein